MAPHGWLFYPGRLSHLEGVTQHALPSHDLPAPECRAGPEARAELPIYHQNGGHEGPAHQSFLLSGQGPALSD